MAERETKRELLGPVTLSVLDRLLDDEPKSKVEGPLTHSKSLAQLKVAIRRDLENLLNTRCTIEPLPESRDRKSTRLNSSHLVISYAVFCLKKKNKNIHASPV